ncbi:hypothetical protein D3C87_2060910 [compost metagenome]
MGVWNVLESFDPSEKESAILRNWLTQRCGKQELSALNVREARSCRGDTKARVSGWMAGRQAQLNQGLNGQASQLKALSVIGGKDDE